MDNAKQRQRVSESITLHELAEATISAHNLLPTCLGQKESTFENNFASLCRAMRLESGDFQMVRQLSKRIFLFVNDGGKTKIR